MLVSKLNKRVAINPVFNWLEDDLVPTWSTLATSATSATTVLTATADEELYFSANDVIKFPKTGEVCLITAVTDTGNALTVVRSFGSTTSANVSAGDYFFKIGTAFMEGSLNTALETKSTITSEVTNYCQIFRKSVEITRTLANTELYGGADRPYQRKKKGIELMKEMERTFMFGEPKQRTGGTHPQRATGGINYFISTNATDAGGTLTESEFETFLRTVFRYGSTTRYLFCSPLIISVISLWAQGKLQMFPKDKTLIETIGPCIKNLTKSVEVYMIIDNTEERLSEKDLGWLSGILDGEGSFGVCNYGRKGIVVRLEISNTDKNLVLEAIKISSKIIDHPIKLKTRIPKSQFEIKNKKRQYSFQLSNMKLVYKLLSTTKNYLRSFKKQIANLICEYADLRKERAYKSSLTQREQDILSHIGKIRNDYTSDCVIQKI